MVKKHWGCGFLMIRSEFLVKQKEGRGELPLYSICGDYLKKIHNINSNFEKIFMYLLDNES